MNKPRRIGLLFVHGIGQQKPWEHLQKAVARMAELLRVHPHKNASVSIVERTGDWGDHLAGPRIKRPHEDEHPAPPMTIHYRVAHEDPSKAIAIDFECHEVWWADLGKRRGLGQAIQFWIWGLGQWNAPIYARRDATKLTHAPEEDTRPGVHTPRSTSRSPFVQIFSRLSLAWAGVVASLIFLSTWGIFRVLSFITGKPVSLDLIVDYLGDVEIYQKRGMPNAGQVSDPGHPTRATIRRRMVSQMVAMGARDYDSWNILAHSLGSVLAFNGIGEIAHALPNYCDEELWNALPEELKQDPCCRFRTDTEAMIPARPAWLKPEDCINKGKLFGNLTNFITYGSPLGSFGAIWPRIVAFEKGVGTPRPGVREHGVFHRTRWINIVSGSDPVSGLAERYRKYLPEEHKNDLPEEVNLIRPGWAIYGASHTDYFKPKWPSALGKGDTPSEYARFHDELIGEIMREPAPPQPLESRQASVASHDRQRMFNSFVATNLVLWACFAGLGLLISLMGGTLPDGFQFFPGAAPYDEAGKINYIAIAKTIPGWAMFWLSLAMGAVYMAGFWRYWREVSRDLQECRYELHAKAAPSKERAHDLKIGITIDRVCYWANGVFGVSTSLAWLAIFASTIDALVNQVWGLKRVETWLVDWFGDARALVPVMAVAVLLVGNSTLQAGLSLWAVWMREKQDYPSFLSWFVSRVVPPWLRETLERITLPFARG